MAKVCEEWFPFDKEKGISSYKGQRSPGFYMCDNLKNTIDLWLKNIKNDWDIVVIISGQETVRVGKSLSSSDKIKVIENGETISKRISEFTDGEKIKTISWDFKNNKEVITESEVIVEKEDKDFYEVELENGKKVVCTMEHKLFVKRKFTGTDDKTREQVVELRLKDIKEGDEIVCLT